MDITHEGLTQQKQALERQRAEYEAKLHQTIGALAMVNALLAQLDKPEPDADEAQAGPRLVESS